MNSFQGIRRAAVALSANASSEVERARTLLGMWIKPGDEVSIQSLMQLDSRTLISILNEGGLFDSGASYYSAHVFGDTPEILRRVQLAPAVLLLVADLRVTL